jgi:hypothetical protein
MRLSGRILALEKQAAGTPEDQCPRRAIGLLIDADQSFTEDQGQPCRCGQVHVLAITEEVVGVAAEEQP